MEKYFSFPEEEVRKNIMKEHKRRIYYTKIKNLYSSKGKDKSQTGGRHKQYIDPKIGYTEYTRNSYKY